VRVRVYYDASLIGVLSGGEDSERLLLEYAGQEISLPADPDNAHRLREMLHAGHGPTPKGAARLITGKADGTPPRYCFDIYPDQTLQRAPELDVFEYNPDVYNVNCIGWRNELNPSGFLAPKGIIPGEQGHFISDSTESFAVDIPYEFTNLCTELKQTPVSVLRDFIANACALRHTTALPRGDGFASQGEEAETMITRYLERVYRKDGE
jgi:hypothetical protein